MSVHQILTLASMVESEGITLEDRKNIAGVFINRLNKKMSLGSDVTTYYAFKIELGAILPSANEVIPLILAL